MLDSFAGGKIRVRRLIITKLANQPAHFEDCSGRGDPTAASS